MGVWGVLIMFGHRSGGVGGRSRQLLTRHLESSWREASLLEIDTLGLYTGIIARRTRGGYGRGGNG